MENCLTRQGLEIINDFSGCGTVAGWLGRSMTCFHGHLTYQSEERLDRQSVMGVRHSDAGGGWKIKLTHIGKSLFSDGFTMR